MHKSKLDTDIILLPVDPVPDVSHLGLAVCEPGWKLPVRVIRDFEWLVMIQGAATFHVGETEYLLKPGDALLIPANRQHRASADDRTGCRFYFVHFIPACEPAETTQKAFLERMEDRRGRLRAELAQGPFISLPQARLSEVPLLTHLSLGRHGDGVCTLFERALEERNHYAADSQLFISLLVTQLLALGSRAVLQESPGKPISEAGVMDRTLQEALSLLHGDHDRHLRIRALAATLGISVQYLGRLFSDRLGCSPLQYVNRLRVDRAKALMRETRLSIQEISWACGFENPFYFSRLFHKLEGEPPSRYRERLAIRSN